MVRLRRLLQDVLDAAALKFTIHYGEIKTSVRSSSPRLHHKFTIHYGEIKTLKRLSDATDIPLFTIHYGEIKTAIVGCTVMRLYDLQSTMVRLRLRKLFVCYSANFLFTIHYGEIKTGASAARRISAENLQSTMVRLRHRRLLFEHLFIFDIYNPLW